MRKILHFFAFLWAGISFVLLLSVFMKMETYERLVMKLPFMKVDPIYTGGNVLYQVAKENRTLSIHEPIFSALFGESDEGYVQIDISPILTEFSDSVDYDHDGRMNFYLKLKNSEYSVSSLDGKPYDISAHCCTDSNQIVRIGMLNPRLK